MSNHPDTNISLRTPIVMCEPVYHNTLPLEEATTTELGGTFLTGTELIKSINDERRVFQRPEPTKELTDKFRYLL